MFLLWFKLCTCKLNVSDTSSKSHLNAILLIQQLMAVFRTEHLHV